MIDALGFLTLAAATWLADDDWHVREAGSAVLAAVGQPAEPTLRHLVAGDDPEAARRAGVVLRSLVERQLPDLLAAVRASIADVYPAWPWLDSLPGDEWTVCAYVAAAGGGGSGPDWTGYREATRLYVADLLRRGATVEEASAVVRRLVEGDREQCRTQGFRWVGR